MRWRIQATLGICLCVQSVAVALDTESVVERNQASVVVILGEKGDAKIPIQSSGCCVSPEGLILTTAHQVKDVVNLRGHFFGGTERSLSLVAVDNQREIALLKPDLPAGKSAHIGDSSTLKSGSELIAIAAPVNLDFTTVTGIVSSTQRTYQGYPVIQTNLPASPGSSGGPVFNKNGDLVGLIIGKLRDQDWMTIVNPINNARSLLEQHGMLPPVDPTLLQGMNEAIIPSDTLSQGEKEAVKAYNTGVTAETPEKKIAAYESATRLLPTFYEAWFNLAIARTTAGDMKQAWEAYTKARTIRPDAIAVHRNMGRIALKMQRMDDAIACFQQASKFAPEDASAYNDLGEAFRQAGQWDKAEQALLKAQQLRHDYALAYYNLGLTYAAMGRNADAIVQLNHYLEYAPSAPDARTVKELIAKLAQKNLSTP